jgi:hypothetical protein
VEEVVVGGLELIGFLVFVALEEEEASLWYGERLLPNAALAHHERRLAALQCLDRDLPTP